MYTFVIGKNQVYILCHGNGRGVGSEKQRKP